MVYKYRHEIILSVIAIAIFYIYPISLVALCTVNLFLALIIYVVRLLIRPSRYTPHNERVISREPLVSIHLPISNENPAIVIQTIKSVLNQSYSNYELLVYDNNTAESSVWKPIGDFCKSCGSNIKFYHNECVSGYKAGALNICLDLTSAEAEYIFVVDADYNLSKDALYAAVSSIQHSGYSLVQFPQDYYNTSDETVGLKNNFKSYFDVYAQYSSNHNAMLCTGVMCIINKTDLLDIGKWDTHTITEDAELGLKFLRNNYKTTFINRSIGKGLTPHDIKSLRKQRARWIHGNIQTLISAWNAPISLKQKLCCTLQLTAWINFIAYPIIAMLAINIFQIFNPAIEYVHLVNVFSLCSIGLHLLFQILFFKVHIRTPFTAVIKSAMVTFALDVEGAFTWYKGLFNIHMPFIRTEKFMVMNSMRNLPLHLCILFISVAGLFYLRHDMMFFYIAVSLTLLYAVSIYTVIQELKKTTTFKQNKK